MIPPQLDHFPMRAATPTNEIMSVLWGLHSSTATPMSLPVSARLHHMYTTSTVYLSFDNICSRAVSTAVPSGLLYICCLIIAKRMSQEKSIFNAGR